jgi:hypothetical protein
MEHSEEPVATANAVDKRTDQEWRSGCALELIWGGGRGGIWAVDGRADLWAVGPDLHAGKASPSAPTHT